MKRERLALLDEKFRPQDLEWRIQQFGVSNGKPWAKVLCYVTSRAIQNRLDEVCGKDGWSTEIKNIDGAFICRMGINIDGQWVYKEDGADETKVEATKGGISGSIKRAGVQWGIGRYLYDLDEGWAKFVDESQGRYRIYNKDNKTTYYWNPPALPNWALPSNVPQDEKQEAPAKPTPPAEPAREFSGREKALTELQYLVDKYKANLEEPMPMILDCTINGDEQALNAMIKRVKDFLARKHIKVA